LQPEDYRHQSAHKAHNDARDEELAGNHLVILAEDVFGNEGLLVVMPVAMPMVVVGSVRMAQGVYVGFHDRYRFKDSNPVDKVSLS